MKRSQQQQIEYILNLWTSCDEKQKGIDGIIFGGPTVGGKWLENKGDFPQFSTVSFDVMAVKVDRMRKYEFSPDERLVYSIVMGLPDKFRKLLVEHRDRRNKNNAETNAKWTHADIARLLGYREDRYHTLRESVCAHVIELFNKERAKKNQHYDRMLLQLNH